MQTVFMNVSPISCTPHNVQRMLRVSIYLCKNKKQEPDIIFQTSFFCSLLTASKALICLQSKTLQCETLRL